MTSAALGFGYLFYAAMFFGLSALLGALPLLCFQRHPATYGWRFILGAVSGCLIFMACVGYFAYAFVPAQYTRDLRLTSAPRSNSLGSIHGEFLERAKNPEAVSPENVPEILKMVQGEREVFLKRWGLATAALMGAVTILARLTLQHTARRSGDRIDSLV